MSVNFVKSLVRGSSSFLSYFWVSLAHTQESTYVHRSSDEAPDAGQQAAIPTRRQSATGDVSRERSQSPPPLPSAGHRSVAIACSKLVFRHVRAPRHSLHDSPARALPRTHRQGRTPLCCLCSSLNASHPHSHTDLSSCYINSPSVKTEKQRILRKATGPLTVNAAARRTSPARSGDRHATPDSWRTLIGRTNRRRH